MNFRLVLLFSIAFVVVATCGDDETNQSNSVDSYPVSNDDDEFVFPCDQDDDGYLHETCGGGDCNDIVAAINPSMEELPCNGSDDNCNGRRDENRNSYASVSCHENNLSVVFYLDECGEFTGELHEECVEDESCSNGACRACQPMCETCGVADGCGGWCMQCPPLECETACTGNDYCNTNGNCCRPSGSFLSESCSFWAGRWDVVRSSRCRNEGNYYEGSNLDLVQQCPESCWCNDDAECSCVPH